MTKFSKKIKNIKKTFLQIRIFLKYTFIPVFLIFGWVSLEKISEKTNERLEMF